MVSETKNKIVLMVIDMNLFEKLSFGFWLFFSWFWEATVHTNIILHMIFGVFSNILVKDTFLHVTLVVYQVKFK